MYRCESCRKLIGPGVSAQRVTVATRSTSYPARPGVQKQHRDGRTRWVDDPGGTGEEIAREQQMCSACAAAHSEHASAHPS